MSSRIVRVSSLAVGVFLVFLIVAAAQRDDVSGQTASSKLTTLLADLAGAVPQDQGQTPAPRATVLSATDALPMPVRDAIRAGRLRIDASGDVQLYILLQDVTDANLEQLKAAGATIEITDSARRRVQARVAAARLHAIAALPCVTSVRLPTYAVRRLGAVTTEGDAILRANAVRQQLSLDGTGIRVGVVSDGLKGVFASGCTTCGGVDGGPIASGDLPSASGTRNARGVLTASSGGIIARSFRANGDLEGLPPAAPVCAFQGAGAEGTAMLEIIHDLAPGAQLSFANADTDLAFNQAVNFLALTNDVVVDDLGFFGDASDGTSAVSSNTAAALNNPAFPIRTYLTAVGNEADEHYLGVYTDSGVDGASIGGVINPGHVHLFQSSADTTDVLGRGPRPYNLISLPRSGEVVIFLTWDDAFGRAANNYDLYLVQESTGRVVARSVDAQTGTQDPVEVIDYTNNGAADLFRIVVQNVRDSARPRSLNLFSFSPECAADGPRPLAPGRHERHNYNTATRSIAAQGDAGGSPVGVISVGAICSASAAAVARFAGSSAPNESCNDREHSTIEFFSSLGPTLDGRAKPDVSAIDGVSVTGAGRFVSLFFGTSAAAPHVAGLAALTLQAAPCLVSGSSGGLDSVAARSALRNLIVGNAARVNSAGPDNVFGSGRADALSSVQTTLPLFGGSPAITVSGNTALGAALTPSQLGFSDPNRCALTRLSWSGGCGTSPGPTLNCPFGTTKVSVSASNNGVSFSDAAEIQITVSSFGVVAAPASATISAGQSATYQVMVSAQGGAFGDSVRLECSNLPANASCSFNPPAVVPGAGAVPSTLTLSTSAPSQTSSAGWTLSVPTVIVVLAILAIRRRRTAAVGWPVRWRAAPDFASLSRWRCCETDRSEMWSRAGYLAPVSIALALVLACSGGAPPATPPPTQPPPALPVLVVSPSSVTFSSQTVQTTSTLQTVTAANNSSVAVTVSSIAASGDFAQTNNCGTSVAAGTSCAINVTFTPSAPGTRTGTLTVTDSAANSPQTVSFIGTGVAAAAGTPAGTYQVGVNGSAGALTQSSTVSLIVR